jgi:hypothetical protein
MPTHLIHAVHFRRGTMPPLIFFEEKQAYTHGMVACMLDQQID